MKKEEKKVLFKDISTYFIIVVFIILIRQFIVTPIRVNGSSMYETLQNGQIMILDRISYKFSKIKRFDIVVIEHGEDRIIKRIIGLPGEKVKFEDGKLYINDKLVKEDMITQETEDFNIETLGYKKIPKNCYFALGDNRSNSVDSRYFGCFYKEEILGKANLVIFPFKNAGIKK